MFELANHNEIKKGKYTLKYLVIEKESSKGFYEKGL
jgi:hypothetical protein